MFQCLADLAYGDAPRQVLDLYLPDRPAPRLFVFIHGGGWRGGDKEHYRALGELLANFGYAVVLPNHRLAPEHPYPAMAEDVAAAVAWVLRYAHESGVRQDGIFLAGHSSGAHLAALLSLHPRLLPQAGVALGDIAGAICISGVYDLTHYAGPGSEYLEPVFGRLPAALAEASPLHHMRSGAPPFFLAYAEHDYPGAGQQASAMSEALERSGGAAQVVEVPGRNHVTILTGVQSILDPLALGLSLFLRGAR